MKASTLHFSGLALAITLTASIGVAQQTSVVVPAPTVVGAPTVVPAPPLVTTAGTVTELGPDRVIIRTQADPQPIRYTANASTQYVDETGNAVALSAIQPTTPVTVYYTKVGDAYLASKVLVRRGPVNVVTDQAVAPIDTTTTITTHGTLTQSDPGGIVIRSDEAPNPLRYTYTKTTTYVDEAGKPVAIKTVPTGVPVTVYHRRVGDQLVATRVIVRQATVAPPVVAPAPGAVIEEKRTTTTTKRKRDD